MDSSNNLYNNVPSKGMVTDYSEFSNSKEVWLYARNTVVNSQNGDVLSIQNEPSNTFCADFPYTYIGSIKLKNGRYAIFTTDNINHEIGLFDSTDCSYSSLVSNTCFNFSTSSPINGTSKENFDGSETLYWADGQVNELRTLNLSSIPYTYKEDSDECKTKQYSTSIDCNEISFTKKFSIPCIAVKKASFGNLKNGAYQFAVAYSNDSQRFTDYFSTTSPVSIFSHKNNAGALELTLSDIDRDFDKYQLLVIATINNQTFYKVIGEFNVTQTTHVITNIDKPEYIDVPLEEISIKKKYYQSADYLTSNDQFLFASGLSTRPELNYQKQALNIVSKYVVYKVPIDYYATFNNVGYYRDEVYAFSIQWLFEDGEWSSLSHIKGREAKSSELGVVYGDDVFDPIIKCETPKDNKFWQIYNTAEKPSVINNQFEECDRAIVGEGLMAYTESTDTYPDNTIMFGDYACTPIKHHKFPDESKVPRYVYDEKTKQKYIQILGVKFENISQPLDANGKPIPVKGYRIWRGDRNANRSVISRGIFTNVREYQDNITKQKYKYSNYPYNSTKPDLFLSEKQTYFKQNGEKDYVAPKLISQNELTFYSPHTLIDHISLGDYVTFNTHEVGDVTGYFNEVFKHPKAKLLSDKVLYYAIVIGAIDGVMRAFVGARCEIKNTAGTLYTTVGQGSNTATTAGTSKQVTKCNDILKSLGSIDAGASNVGEKVLLKALGTLAKFGAFAFYMAETAQKVIDIIYQSTSWKQYAVQYNSRAEFNVSKIIKPGNLRRRIDSYQYLSSGLNTLQNTPDVQYNNVYKENNVYIKINKPIDLLTGDTSQTSISKTKTCGILNVPVLSKAHVYYGTIKRTFPNQYGQLDSVNYLLAQDCYFKTSSKPSAFDDYTSPVIFGGDCYINRFSINNPTDLFSHPLYNQPDGFEYDYRNYRALAYPRFWADTSPYEFLNIIPTPTLSNKNSFPKESNLPRQKYNLDCKNKKGFSLINSSYFYTSINGVFDFVVESDYNLDLRDWKKPSPDFYTANSNLQKLFENKGEDREYEEFIYDKSFSKQNVEDKYFQQALDYDPLKDISYERNKMIYSLPSYKEQKFDNWLNFLPNNYFNFPNSQFGNLTSIKLIENQQLIFLFDKSSPLITPGRAELKTIDNKTIYLGDGSLIREPRPLLITDDNFGNCQSRYAFNYTKFGFFYPSQRKGNLFLYNSNLDEISRNGMYYFFNKELPSKLLKYYPNFADSDNPFSGVGLTSSYDATSETYFLTKKDYVPKLTSIIYDEKNKQFYNGNTKISLSDRRYFDDASWTISYNPSLKAFISYHDYTPSDYITTENHFYSIVNNNGKSSIYLHNDTCESYCNFYGVNYPHGFTLPINNGPNVEILNSVEYLSEVFIYANNCKDKYHVLNETYDRSLIYNTEQCSGWLKLIPKEKNKMSEVLKYDKLNVTPEGFSIYIDKVEQKYRFNQFKDIIKDRSLSEPIILTDPSGYKFDVNLNAIDYNKSIYDRQAIRHNHSRLYLEKTISNNKKYMFYFSNLLQTNSPR